MKSLVNKEIENRITPIVIAIVLSLHYKDALACSSLVARIKNLIQNNFTISKTKIENQHLITNVFCCIRTFIYEDSVNCPQVKEYNEKNKRLSNIVLLQSLIKHHCCKEVKV